MKKRRMIKNALKLLILSACCLLAGCRRIGGVYLSASLKDTYIAATDRANLTIKECNLIFMDYQNRYNAYYSQTGLSDFWNMAAGDGTFADYLKENRIKEEICALLLLNDMAEAQGIVLDDEEKEACRTAAGVYYGALSQTEREFCRADETDVEGLYRKYRLAQKMISSLTEDAYLEVSDNDKRVITIQLICTDDREKAEEVYRKAEDGADFLQMAKEISRLEKIEYQVSRGELSPVLEEVAFYLEDGEISQVLESEGQYFIIKCVDDFEEELSMANEKSVYQKSIYEQWYPCVKEYAEKCSVSFQPNLWDKMQFYETQAMSADNLYRVYDQFLGNN